jgi:tripartite-type tricarboxylate transporter receptor subunit TctC
MNRPSRLTCLLAAVVSIATAGSARAADGPVADFYAGKTITLYVGSAEAGVYSQAAHLIATYLRRYIPAAPAIIVKNMPGGSSVRAAEYLYNVAPRDGTTLGYLQPTIVLHKVLHPEAKFKPDEFGWLGRVASMTGFGIAWPTAAAHTVEEAKQHQVIVAADGPQGIAAITPWALNRIAGTRFKVVVGYDGGIGAQSLAMERGEVDGLSSVALRYVRNKPNWKVNFLYVISTERDKNLPRVPAITELASSPQDKAVMSLLGTTSDIGQSLLTTEEVPPDRLRALTTAFDALVKDQEFITALGEIEFSPLPRSALSEIIATNSRLPPDIVARTREVTQPQD